MMHHARADTDYYYRVGDPKLGFSPEYSFRTARDAAVAAAFPHRFGLVGDLGQTEHSAQTLEHLVVTKPDSVLSVGELTFLLSCYTVVGFSATFAVLWHWVQHVAHLQCSIAAHLADRHSPVSQALQASRVPCMAILWLTGDMSYADGFHPRWDSWGRLVQPSTAVVPWMVIEGNHEEEAADGVTAFLAYQERFQVPAGPSSSGTPMYYSYEVR